MNRKYIVAMAIFFAICLVALINLGQIIAGISMAVNMILSLMLLVSESYNDDGTLK